MKRFIQLVLLVSFLGTFAIGAGQSSAAGAEPYRDPAFDTQFRQLIEGVDSGPYAADEAAIPNTPLGHAIRDGLQRARMAAGTLPPLWRIGAIYLTAGPWTATWKINRPAGPYWLRLSGAVGTLQTTNNLHGGGWKWELQGSVTLDTSTGQTRPLIDSWVAWGLAGSVVEVNRVGCPDNMGGPSCGPFYADFSNWLATLPFGLGDSFGTGTQSCGYGTCEMLYASEGDMTAAVQVDPMLPTPGPGAVSDYTTTWNGTWDAEAARLVLDGEQAARMWVNHELDPTNYPDPLLTIASDQTFGDHSTRLAENPTHMWAEPVDSATGSYFTSVTDVALPGIGVPFRFKRSYNSADATQGQLGRGWTASYLTSLSFGAQGDVTVRAGDGQRLTYVKNPDGSFSGSAGTRAKLAAISGGYELTLKDQERDRYDTQGRLTAVLDRNGNTISFAYDGAGQLTSATDTAGRTITFTVTNGLLIAISLPDGRGVQYGYTGGNLTSVTDLRGGATAYMYDAGARLSKIIDQNSSTIVENAYGSDGRITDQWDGLRNHGTFGWNAATQTATFTDARGKVWTDVYSSNVLLRSVDPLGNTTSYAYDFDLNAKQVTDARGKTTTYTHDGSGNVLTVTAPAPLSFTRTYTYTARNDVATFTDARNNTTQYDYDANGNLIKITRPGSNVTLYGRDTGGKGLLASVTDPRGKVWSLAYDAAGNLTRKTSPLGFITTMGYDSSGRMTSLVEPRGNVTGGVPSDYTWTYGYDNADHLISQIGPLAHETKLGYDPAGYLASRTDANNRATVYGYDAANHLTSVRAPDLSVTAYGYDPAGNLSVRTDAKNHTTTYDYDDAGRLAGVTSPLGQHWTYAYDGNGNRTRIVDANGNGTQTAGDGTTNFGYDESNRLTTISYSDTTPAVQLGYDANNNRTSMTDGSGSASYTYDVLNRLTAATRGTDSFSYVYDAGDNVTKRTYPSNTFVDYTYDNDGRLATTVAGSATTAYAYDAAANLTKATLPTTNGYVENRTYDRAGRLTDVQNIKGTTNLSRFTYTLDAVGNPTAVNGTSTTTYKYDTLDRVTEACFAATCTTGTSPFIRYAYDGVGNRTSEARSTGTTTYTYNVGDQLTSKAGASTGTYTYDTNGNEVSAPSRTFAYDLANRLKSTTSGSTTIAYTYDGDGRRLQASSGSSAASKTNFLWDPNFALPQLALERNGSNALLRRYVYGADLLSMNAGGADYYFHHDRLGSTANLTSSTGATQWTYVYEPYGTARTETKVNNKAPVSPMKFTGQYFDSASSLYHLRARQYDATLGRFLALDPIPASTQKPVVSPYAYADARPTVLVDPSGNEPNRWGHLAFAVWEAFDAATMYGLAIGVGYGCTMAEGLSLGLGVVVLGPPCAVGTLGPAGVGYWESRQSGSEFYDFLHPEELGKAMK
ncbi:MAG: DUF6531 domain-containing protein [Actinomycetota bacterium]|nr:DUF6531 domain-containing protein [Actinomycetota bacterium]